MWFKKKEIKKLNMSKYCLKNNLISIINWERMSGKSFYEFNEDSDDVVLLFYCSFISNNDISITYDAFKILLEDEKIMKWFISKYQELVRFNQQFNKKEVSEEKEEDDENKITFTDIATNLIVQYKMDSKYVLYEMPLWLIEYYYNVGNTLKQNNLEEQRLWTYLTMLPHIDGNKVKKPQDLLKFPWELEEEKKQAEKDIADKQDMIKNILGNSHEG